MRNHLEHRLPWSALAALVQLKCVRDSGQHEARLSHKQLKSVFHFGRCLADAIREFAATDKSPDDVTRQYDARTWDATVLQSGHQSTDHTHSTGDIDNDNNYGDDNDGADHGSDDDSSSYDGDSDDLSFETSIVEGYVELNLILADPKRFAPLLMGYELERTDAMDAMCALRRSAHPLWLARHLEQAFSGDCLKPLTLDVLQVLRDHCSELFRCMYSLRDADRALDAAFVTETIAKRFGIYYDLCLWRDAHPETPLS